MYPLVVLTALALGLFVLSRVREKLEPTETIREPVDLRGGMEQAKPEIERVWNLLDDTTKNAFVTFAQTHKDKLRAPPEMEATEIAQTLAYDFVYSGFYGSVYRGSATPITESQIDEFIQSMIGFMEPRSGSEEEPPFINLLKDGTIKRGIMMIYLPTASSRSMTDTRTSSTTTTATTTTTSTPTPSSTYPPTMDELNKQFDNKMNMYNSVIDTSIQNPSLIARNLEVIKTLNVEISQILDQMLTLSTRRDTPQSQSNLGPDRDELVYKLQRIQRDYNGLLENTDKLETLRRIRQFEEKDWKREMTVYLIVFLVIALVLLIVMILRRQKKETATIIPTMPASTAPLI